MHHLAGDGGHRDRSSPEGRSVPGRHRRHRQPLGRLEAASACGVASDAIAKGRRVIWIEDFYGEIPESAMPAGVEYVDTASTPGGAVLIPKLVPAGLLET